MFWATHVSLRAYVLHTINCQSELLQVLRTANTIILKVYCVCNTAHIAYCQLCNTTNICQSTCSVWWECSVTMADSEHRSNIDSSSYQQMNDHDHPEIDNDTTQENGELVDEETGEFVYQRLNLSTNPVNTTDIHTVYTNSEQKVLNKSYEQPYFYYYNYYNYYNYYYYFYYYYYYCYYYYYFYYYYYYYYCCYYFYYYYHYYHY